VRPCIGITRTGVARNNASVARNNSSVARNNSSVARNNASVARNNSSIAPHAWSAAVTPMLTGIDASVAAPAAHDNTYKDQTERQTHHVHPRQDRTRRE